MHTAAFLQRRDLARLRGMGGLPGLTCRLWAAQDRRQPAWQAEDRAAGRSDMMAIVPP